MGRKYKQKAGNANLHISAHTRDLQECGKYHKHRDGRSGAIQEPSFAFHPWLQVLLGPLF